MRADERVHLQGIDAWSVAVPTALATIVYQLVLLPLLIKFGKIIKITKQGCDIDTAV